MSGRRKPLAGLTALLVLLSLTGLAAPSEAAHLVPGTWTYTVAPNTAGLPMAGIASLSGGTFPAASLAIHFDPGEVHAHAAGAPIPNPLGPPPFDGPACEPNPGGAGCVDPDGAGPTPFLDPDADVAMSLVAVGDFSIDGCGVGDLDGIVPDTAALTGFWNDQTLAALPPFVGVAPAPTVAGVQVAEMEIPTTLLVLYAGIFANPAADGPLPGGPGGPAIPGQPAPHYDLSSAIPVGLVFCSPALSPGNTFSFTATTPPLSVANPLGGSPGGAILEMNGPANPAASACVFYLDGLGFAPHSACAGYAVLPPLPPVAVAPPDFSVSEGDGVTLAGTVGDPNLEPLAWTWDAGLCVAGGSISPPYSGTVDCSYTAPFVGAGGSTETSTLSVVDLTGLPAADSVVVTINNNAPTADSGPNQTVNEGDPVSLAGSTSGGNAPVSESWSGACSSASGTCSYTAGDGPSTDTNTYAATDADADSASDPMTVTINNLPPTAVMSAPGAPVPCGTSYTLDASGSTDPAGAADPLSFLWSGGGVGGATTPSVTDSVPCASAPATVIYGVTVDDGDGGSSTAGATVSVLPPPPVDASVDMIVHGPTKSVASGGSRKTVVAKVCDVGGTNVTFDTATDLSVSATVNGSPAGGTFTVLNPGTTTLIPGGCKRYRVRWDYGLDGPSLTGDTVVYTATISTTYPEGTDTDPFGGLNTDSETRTAV